MFGDLILTSPNLTTDNFPRKIIMSLAYDIGLQKASAYNKVMENGDESEKRRASALVDQLLMDIYNSVHTSTDYNSTSGKSHKSSWAEVVNLEDKDLDELLTYLTCLKNYVERMGSVLVRQLKRRDALRRQRDAYCDVITEHLGKCVPEGDSSEDRRFSIHPLPGDTGFSQWANAMKMVAQLPGGIPPEFRRRLWLTLADKHLLGKGVDWPKVERTCFSEWSHPADAELGVQIVKDLHRTGCSLFCGEDGQENQVLLKRVLLAYARWNKVVGYCQGFNMLAALILQVTEKCESDALKLMIYLIEGVLPDSYFADSLRGLSVDMAVFRELLRTRFPRLSKHLDNLQNAAKDGSRSYEPPLTNVFTMQWFLTLFCNCLPHPTVLRVWDLILLEGNEVLLRTALAIWQVLADKILTVRSADEFYCMMGVLTRELLEFELVDGNTLIKAVVDIGPLTELNTLREHYLYNINPWGATLPQTVDKQLKLYPKQSIALDISGLKKQYAKLKQRQRQAHIIISAAISRQSPPAPPVTMNHLLLGKSALIPAKRLGPPKGAIPPARQISSSTLHWKDAPKQTSSSSSSDTELCDEENGSSDEEELCQLDHLPLDNDKDLMKIDNTSATVEIETNSSPSKNETLLTTDNVESDDNLIVFKTESDDENFDFEQFLSDRLKVDDLVEEQHDYSRRNSERALKIIQENSLILHRILQCQPRLSPSPPLTIEPVKSPLDNSFGGNYSEVDNYYSNKYATQNQIDMGKTEDVKSPEYGSKYTSILEKSKSLDEKYNELILNKPTSKTFEGLSAINNDFRKEMIIEPKLFTTINEENSGDINNVQLNEEDIKTIYNKSNLSPNNIKFDSTKPETIFTFDRPYISGQFPIEIDSASPKKECKSTIFDPTDSHLNNCEVTSNVLSTNQCSDDVSTTEDSIFATEIHDDILLEELKNYDVSTDVNIVNSPLRWTPSTTCYSYLTADEEGISSIDKFKEKCDINPITKPFHLDVLPCTSSNPKSPSKTPLSPSKSPFRSPNQNFNPFPVPLCSRQSKEVPLKLGLYKK
ncbi:uncharacterized protein LOC130444061 isoform X1 [Diorhabda sublineata]|uniref:uncharacterized protein LOC130444061 isoform X1 n=1 Tax=Diorhabda sublineata TaxID=1163346 RepID=UPI0024E095FD|nr:uncharacterized protein LOC130444061 isoform X1 [Diorhabda sublineata]